MSVFHPKGGNPSLKNGRLVPPKSAVHFLIHKIFEGIQDIYEKITRQKPKIRDSKTVELRKNLE
jgi:hypothetical protein